MLCASIVTDQFSTLQTRAWEMVTHAALIEIRVDALAFVDYEELKQLVDRLPIDVVLTLRTQCQGGFFSGSREEYEQKLQALLHIQPAFLDVEWGCAPSFYRQLDRKRACTQLILSHHDMNATPQDLEGIYRSMQSLPAAYYKIGGKATSSLDALRMLCFTQKVNREKDGNVIGFCTGIDGQLTRVLAPFVGTPFMYAAAHADEPGAEGQMAVSELLDIYQARTFSPEGRFFALIGDPVCYSAGIFLYNTLFQQFHQNACYVNIRLTQEEIKEAASYLKALNVSGLSVTMPLKAAAVDVLDDLGESAAAAGVVNHIVVQEGKWIGQNTDGVAVLEAVEARRPIAGKRVLILGAGGTAKAVAAEVTRRGGKGFVANRTHKKAQRVAQLFSMESLPLEKLLEVAREEPFDVIVHCTPVGMSPHDENSLVEGELFEYGKPLVLDVVAHPVQTKLLCEAQQHGCEVITGVEMSLRLEQMKGWNLIEGGEASLEHFIRAYLAIKKDPLARKELQELLPKPAELTR